MQLDADQPVALAVGHRLQFEAAQGCFVLLFPEGMVELNDVAAEVLGRCKEPTSLRALVTVLAAEFEGDGIEADVTEFLQEALTRGWVTRG